MMHWNRGPRRPSATPRWRGLSTLGATATSQLLKPSAAYDSQVFTERLGLRRESVSQLEAREHREDLRFGMDAVGANPDDFATLCGLRHARTDRAPSNQSIQMQ